MTLSDCYLLMRLTLADRRWCYVTGSGMNHSPYNRLKSKKKTQLDDLNGSFILWPWKNSARLPFWVITSTDVIAPVITAEMIWTL